MTRIGVALIGSGIFIKEQHLPAVQGTEILEVKAIFSRSTRSAKTVADGANLKDVDIYSEDPDHGHSYAELLKREDIHGVIIALPIGQQDEYIKQALTAGKHVLSEKPIAKDIAAAKALMKWYEENIHGKSMWGIAENYRFYGSLRYAAEQTQKFGRLLHFKLNAAWLMAAGSPYHGTAWRKDPTHQGGFVLDTGVHYAAGMRLLLHEENAPERVASFASQLQKHLPPVDTIDAIIRTKSGAQGSYSQSSGSTLNVIEMSFAFEKGSVKWSVNREENRVVRVVESKESDKEPHRKDFVDEFMAIKPEIQAWAESLRDGKLAEEFSPAEAMRDLEFIEAVLQSSEKEGEVVKLTL